MHSETSRYSQTLTTLSCGHPIKAYEDKNIDSEWQKIKVANYTGFVRSAAISAAKVQCWQDKHSRFFSGMELEISDIY